MCVERIYGAQPWQYGALAGVDIVGPVQLWNRHDTEVRVNVHDSDKRLIQPQTVITPLGAACMRTQELPMTCTE